MRRTICIIRKEGADYHIDLQLLLGRLADMGLVKYALKFRVTFYVLCLLMMLGGVGAIIVMPKDVLWSVYFNDVVIV